jgi:acyl-CoA hydrolase
MTTEWCTAEEAVDRMRVTDTIAMPLGPGQPAGFITALGTREDWEELRLYGALLVVPSAVFGHPNVHYLSGFFGPFERALRAPGANIGFAPADFRRFAPMLEETAPRVVTTVATPPDAEGWCSLSLHAGASVGEIERAGADPDRVLLVEMNERLPRTSGLGEHRHAVHVDSVDIAVRSDLDPFVMADAEPTDTDRAIAAHVAGFVSDGATLQTGIGAVPSVVAGLLAAGDGGDYGIHSEMFTTGLMQLHKSGKVTNQKGIFDGHSITTFCAGTAELYEWLDGNDEVAFLPVDVVNSPEVIAQNRKLVSINAALAVDIQGQVVADTIHGVQFSGIGGHEDFVAGAGLDLEDRSLLCLPSTFGAGDAARSRIVTAHPAGAVITTPRHQVDVIVTEFGAAELQGKTVHQRGLALAEIAHPDVRDELREAAERASGGNSPLPV